LTDTILPPSITENGRKIKLKIFVSSKDNVLYRIKIQSDREWNIKGGYGWQGKAINAPAETRYPNLVAELGWSCPWLYLLAEFADVSREIMAAALEDNEELSFPELFRLSRYLGVPLEYLTAPDFSMVDPSTNKGKAKRRKLADLARVWADKLDCWGWKVKLVLDALNNGKPVTYASYHWAVGELESAADRHRRKQHKPRSRRMMTV